jgi:hypothetical protein
MENVRKIRDVFKMTQVDPELVAIALENLVTIFAEETDDRLTRYEIRLIDAGASDAARAFLLAEYRQELEAEYERIMRKTEAWLATNPQPGDRLNLRKSHALN